MKIKPKVHWIYALIVAGLLAIIPTYSTFADTGPKPSMNFTFIFETTPAPEVSSGTLLECSDAACATSEPLKQLGPQHFDCSTSLCSSIAYGYSEYQRLVIEFSDGITRTSNVFTKTKFAADYKVSVYADRLEVVEQAGGASWPITGNTVLDLLIGAGFFCFIIANLVILVVLLVRAGRTGATFKSMPGWYIASWILAIPSLLVSLFLTRGLIATLIVELTLGVVYVFWRKHPKMLFLTVILLINLITQPALWLTISGFSGRYPIIIVLIAEAFVWLLEAAGIFLALRKRVRFGEAILVSLVLNAVSFGLGMFLPL